MQHKGRYVALPLFPPASFGDFQPRSISVGCSALLSQQAEPLLLNPG